MAGHKGTITGKQGFGVPQEDTHDTDAYAVPCETEIPAREWLGFFDSFSRQHQGWLTSIAIAQSGDEQTEVQECRLEGISVDHLSTREEIYISFGKIDGGHITHAITHPVRVTFKQDAQRAHEGLQITSDDGTRTNLRFRVAAVPETLDGVLEDATGPHGKQPTSEQATKAPFYRADAHIPVERTMLQGTLVIPDQARGMVLFAHGSGSSRHSPRNCYVAEVLQNAGFGPLLMDLLTAEEEALDQQAGALRFDIGLLATRLAGATWWLVDQSQTANLPIGYFGASTGAAAALVAGANESDLVSAIVSRGGRPDLAGTALNRVITPTLLIVGGNDAQVLELNQSALKLIPAPRELEVVPQATHLFEEPGALESVAALARNWFSTYLARSAGSEHAA